VEEGLKVKGGWKLKAKSRPVKVTVEEAKVHDGL
jgi:hypothetical protein